MDRRRTRPCRGGAGVAAPVRSKDVRFDDADPDVIDAVEAAYRTKYAAFAGILDRSMTPRLRAAVLQLVAR